MRKKLLKVVEYLQGVFRKDFAFFVLFFVLGYVFGLLKIHTIIYSVRINFEPLYSLGRWFVSLFTKALNLAPNPDFLSDVAAFSGVLIALAIPLSFETIFRISDKYQSDLISDKFDKEFINNLLPVFLVVTILLAVILRFLVGDSPNSVLWKILAWALLFFFIAIPFLLFWYIKNMRSYMNSGRITNEFLKNAQKIIKK